MIPFPKFRRIVEAVRGIGSMMNKHRRQELEERLKPPAHASQSDEPLRPPPGEPGQVIDVLG